MITIPQFYLMLSEPRLKLLNDFVQSASIEELIYASGFIEGYRIKNAGNSTGAAAITAASIALKPTIVYATETGNAKKVATQLLTNFKKKKINARSVDIQQFNLSKIGKEDTLLFIISTQGDGDLPETAVAFYDELTQSNIDLQHLSYAIFGLGDTAYPLFCNAAILLDEALTAKGAKAIQPVVKADLDYHPLVSEWEHNLFHIFSTGSIVEPANPTTPAIDFNHRKHYKGSITNKVILNDIGSNKTTYHIEIESKEEVHYHPGDALGLVPKNKAADIFAILAYFEVKDDAVFEHQNETRTAFEWLENRNIKGLSKRNVQQVATLFNKEAAARQTDLIDLISNFEQADRPSFEALIDALSPVLPRLYSISSSVNAHNGQVHLTVNHNTFEVDNIRKTGLASDYLGLFEIGSGFEFYIHPNPGFRLPEDDKDVIMIGPGTGIAPFRSFLAERDIRGAEGKNWLFFGEQHFVDDFYYQTEIQEWLSTGTLQQLSTAFSRDQAHKVYVQDRIREQAGLFNEWLESGAYVYLCGQKAPMSVDVENVILEVLQSQRNIDKAAAEALLEELEMSGRYLKDVY